MDLIDIKIENGRFVFDEQGDIVFVKGAERVRQQVEIRLSLWAGEWFLDTDFGTPYLLRIMGKAAITLDAAVDALRQQVMDVDGVVSINRLDYDFDAKTRLLKVDMDIQSEYGIVTYQSAAQLEAAAKVTDRTAIDMRATTLDPRIIVNTNPVHGIRGAGDYLVATREGEYPAEMVNNVQVGRQLPVREMHAIDDLRRSFVRMDVNDHFDDSPGMGIRCSLIGAQKTTTEHGYYGIRYFDSSSIGVGDSVRFEVFLKVYNDNPRRAQVQLWYGDADNVLIASADLDPSDGTFHNQSPNVKGLKSIPYGGGWWRFSGTYITAQASAEVCTRVLLSDSTLTNFMFIADGDYADAVVIAQPRFEIDEGAVSSVRPDGIQTSPGGDIAVAKMYGATGVRVALSNGVSIDLPFGSADHVNLPTNPYDVGDAFITRIEYTG